MAENIIPKTDILKKLWLGKATIFEYKSVTDPVTHQTKHGLVPVVTDEPCRLSYKNDTVTNLGNNVPRVHQIISLFISPDIEIQAGAVIEITQHGRTNRYKRGSKPAVYTNHQEVILEIDEGV